ncbi:MAG: TdeIII family type II restriction endonuclease [bacterium]
MNRIHYKLRKGEIPARKMDEVEQIRKEIKKGQARVDPDSIVDLFVKIKDTENYFDITSAKPNMKEFVALILKLLRWTALRLSQDKNANVFTRLAIPYNPYHPEPYERWTLKGLYDLKKGEILVGEEFWNFVASGNIYEELLNVFQKVGEELREEIDKKFDDVIS